MPPTTDRDSRAPRPFARPVWGARVVRRVALYAVAILALVASAPTAAQDLPLVRIRVSVLGPDGAPVPVGRHALLVSDEPVSAAPRRVVTSADGTAELRLRPGTYIIESDQPFVLDARAYEWIQPFTVTAGTDAAVELTTANASVGPAMAEAARPDRPLTTAEKSLAVLHAWQGSVFEIWTAHTHAAGFLADATGLVATSLRAIDHASSVEVQVSSSVKVTGRVVASDADTDVAIIRVHPYAVDGVRPIVFSCDAETPAAATGDRSIIAAPMFGLKDADADLVVPDGSAGGPVLSPEGEALGLSSPEDNSGRRGRMDVRVVGKAGICSALATARATLDAAPPPDTKLPMEPAGRVASVDDRRAPQTFSLSSYQVSTSDFDVTFITPAVLVGAEARREFTGGREEGFSGLRVATDFEHWFEYVTSAPPMLYVRVTPRLVEGFWMKVARGAASTQGAAIPPIKRLRPGFSRMRLLCGATEVTPVHPFRIQSRVSEAEAIEEGFYVFDPAAISPACGTVSVVLSSVKEPDKTDTRAIDPAIVRRVVADFAR